MTNTKKDFYHRIKEPTVNDSYIERESFLLIILP